MTRKGWLWNQNAPFQLNHVKSLFFLTRKAKYEYISTVTLSSALISRNTANPLWFASHPVASAGLTINLQKCSKKKKKIKYYLFCFRPKKTTPKYKLSRPEIQNHPCAFLKESPHLCSFWRRDHLQHLRGNSLDSYYFK